MTRLLKNVWRAGEEASCLEGKHCARTTRRFPFRKVHSDWSYECISNRV